MTHTPHARLTPAEVKALWEQKCFAAKGYLYLLTLAHRRVEWSWRIENVSEFCKEWNIPRRTFYKAKTALISDGLMSEDIIGAFELTPHACVPQGTGVPQKAQLGCALEGTGVNCDAHEVQERAHGVPQKAQSVQQRAHLQPESIDIQEACDPTSLNTFKTTTYTDSDTQESVCGGGDESVRKDGTTLHDEKGEISNCDSNPKDEFIPPILQSAKNFGVNIDDRQLRKAVDQWPERVETAIACLEEKQLTVKHPTRYLTRAIEDDWQPEKGVKRAGWREWWDEAYKRGLVKASQGKQDTIMVLTLDDHWVPFEHLRRQSWEELEAQLKPITVETQATPDELTPGQSQIIDAMAVLVEG